MKTNKAKIIAFSVSALILAIVLVLNIAVGVMADVIDRNIVGVKPTESTTVSLAEGPDLVEQIQGEGTVLLKNEDNLLPMKLNDGSRYAGKVNVFGWDSSDWVICGSGSGQVQKSGAITKDDTKFDLLEALTEANIEYNTELAAMYEKFAAHRAYSENGGAPGDGAANAGTLKSFNYEFSRLYEPSISDTEFYPQNLLDNAIQFSDTAIVAIGRVSGESNDSPKVQYKVTGGTKRGTSGEKVVTDETRTYLEISTEEEELLTYVGANYAKVIVLINTTNVMELGFLNTIDGIGAALLVATTGSTGTRMIPRMLYSDITDEKGNNVSVTPSGKLADTYAYDLSTAATYVNTGSGNPTTHFYTNTLGDKKIYPVNVQHTNGSKNEPYAGAAYTDYQEGIYVGYKWYETADAEKFWDSDFAKNQWDIKNGYQDVVQFPFGYGDSYTKFEWKVTYLSLANGSTLKADDKIEIGLMVKNTGDFAGQDVVELYYSAPYKEGKIEKSALNLVAFGKTSVLQPGEEGGVVLNFKVADMKSYDFENLSGKVGDDGGYILEKGDYSLTLRTDAHTLAGKKIVSGGSDTITYHVSDDILYEEDTVKNRFTGTNTTDGVAIDGNSDGNAEITYLKRSDFEGTFPVKMSDDRNMTDAIKVLNLYSVAQANEWAQKHPVDSAPTFGDKSQSGLVYENDAINDLGMELGLDYNNPKWEALLNRISENEMKELVLHGYTKTGAIASIGKPETLDLDGPNQIGSFSGGVSATTTGFSSIVLAQTWNLNLATAMGRAIGKECLKYHVSGWYGPGINLHRSPFGGRNYEYYSEDSFISGMFCAKTVQAAKNKGVFSYLKHLCLYEGESGRDGMYNWLTEQALREEYIKPFEIAVKEGGSTAIMTSYGRIGAIWTGGSEALLTEVVRGEWGFQGAFLTDYADHHDFMNGDQMLRAGGDLWMDWYQANSAESGKFTKDTSSNEFKHALRNATKNIVYMWLNALATNADYNNKIASGEISDDVIEQPTPTEFNFRWYIPVLIVVDVLAVAGCGLWIFFTLRKKNEAVTETAGTAEPETHDNSQE